jgi:hypothetical protein
VNINAIAIGAIAIGAIVIGVVGALSSSYCPASSNWVF